MSLLQGIKVLSVEQYGAGPFGTQLLVELGAEVVKIESPTDGDISRHVGPHFNEELPATAQSLFYQSLNLGKKSVTLNMLHPDGQAIFHKLVAQADVVSSNLRGDVPVKLGLTYAQLRHVNPAIVCAHLTGYGREGERASWPGYDYLMQAEAGYFDLTGEPNSPPARMGLSVVDYMTGVMLALAAVSAVVRARATGLGCDTDVNLFDVALYNLNYLAAWQLNAGASTTRQPRSAHPSLTPCQLYKTADGWIYLMCNKDKFWRVLCERVGQTQWLADARFSSFAQRLVNRDALTVLLDGALSEKTTAEWMLLFGGSVPASSVLTVDQALQAPFVGKQGLIVNTPLPTGGSIRGIRAPIRSSVERKGPLQPGPTLGQHTDEVLAQAGIGEDERNKLRASGIL
ncbi:MAG: CoA transferase [Polaromonas sp.]|nr:CoA transferase [Polaromonas sp.]